MPSSRSLSVDGRPSASRTSPDPKRRKIRKGTHSCWACKRKKIRCTFSAPDGASIDPEDAAADWSLICDGCRRRGIACVRQDVPETEAAAVLPPVMSGGANNRQVDDRLGRMEALVEMLVRNSSDKTARLPPGGVPMAYTASGASRSSRTPRLSRTPGTASPHTAGPPRAAPSADHSAEHSDDDEDLGPDNLQSNPHDTPDSTVLPASGLAGLATPSESVEWDRPNTYTSWFGHNKRGIEEEETVMSAESMRAIAAAMPSSAAGPATPASTDTSAISPTCSSCPVSGSSASNPLSSSGSTKISSPATSVTHFHLHPPHNYIPTSLSLHDEYMMRYQMLSAAWPTHEDLAIIVEALSIPERRSGLNAAFVNTPVSAVLAAEMLPPPLTAPPLTEAGTVDAAAVLVLPPVGTHLVLVAQKLLVLASFLQHMHPQFDPALTRLRMPYRTMMHRAVCATTVAVTGNDSLTGSFEGVQCLVMLGAFQANQGNLRRAWLSFRRAMVMAQLMGMQRGLPMSTMKDPDDSCAESDKITNGNSAVRRQLYNSSPKCLWFRIVYADRYLSLMLGLPQGASGDAVVQGPKPTAAEIKSMPFFSKAVLEQLRIEEAHAVIAGRINERNEAWRFEGESDYDGGRASSDSDDDEDEEEGDDEATNMGDNDNSNNANCNGNENDGDAGTGITTKKRGSKSSVETVADVFVTPFLDPILRPRIYVPSTHSIDVALQRASRSMPARWWLAPQLEDLEAGGDDIGIDATDSRAMTIALDTQRLVDQLFHYMLLTQLHLPFVMRRRSDGECIGTSQCAAASTGKDGKSRKWVKDDDRFIYSKITCVNASREVLTRYLSLRRRRQATFFCRSLDFFALLASMTLCLTHLDSHRQEQLRYQKKMAVKSQKAAEVTPAGRQPGTSSLKKKRKRGARRPDPNWEHPRSYDVDDDRNDADFLSMHPGDDYLAHQRLGDRGMMERVLTSMEDMARMAEEDTLLAKSVAFLRRMLDIEDEASSTVLATMGCTMAKAELQARADSKAAADAASKSSNDDGTLRVWLPLMGTIRISKEGILRMRGNECVLVLRPDGRTEPAPSPVPASLPASAPKFQEKHQQQQPGPQGQQTQPLQLSQQVQQEQQQQQQQQELFRHHLVPQGTTTPPANNTPIIPTSTSFVNQPIGSLVGHGAFPPIFPNGRPPYQVQTQPPQTFVGMTSNSAPGLTTPSGWQGADASAFTLLNSATNVRTNSSRSSANEAISYPYFNMYQAQTGLSANNTNDNNKDNDSNPVGASSTGNANMGNASMVHSGMGHTSMGNSAVNGIAPANDFVGNPGSAGFGDGNIVNSTGIGLTRANDWALQGVDFAFFENLLMHGGLGGLDTDDAWWATQEAGRAAEQQQQ